MSRAARMGVLLAAIGLGLGLLTPQRRALAQEPDLLVTNQQIVTLSGNSPSLRGIIQQLCAASGVELRQYDAEDRPFAGSYETVPLAKLLPRLLRSESYAVGMRQAAGNDNPRIAWVRVMGASTGKPAQAFVPRPVPVASPAAEAHEPDDNAVPVLSSEQASNVIVALLNPAYTTLEDEEARRVQVEKIVQRFAENPDAKETLARADPTLVGTKLAELPDARAVFAMIQSGIRDPEVQRHFNAIAGALNGALNRRPTD